MKNNSKLLDYELLERESTKLNLLSQKEDLSLYQLRKIIKTLKLIEIRKHELNDEYNRNFGKDIEYFYHTHDLMTYDGLPFIGSIDNNLFLCTGFNKWGNTNGMLSGKIISDLICEKNNRYALLFSPKRGMSFDKIKNIFLYNITLGSTYILNKVSSFKKFYGEDVKIKYIDGKKCGVYIDENGCEHVVSNICPHMKCNLVFNYVDKTWDCPCHASRFSVDGDIIYGPSVFNIKLSNKN